MEKFHIMNLSEDKKLRAFWNENDKKWYFSTADILALFTNYSTPERAKNHWKDFRRRLYQEGNETLSNLKRFKFIAANGRMRKTDVVDGEQFFRLIQSIPSHKAELYKLWLVQAGLECLKSVENRHTLTDGDIKTTTGLLIGSDEIYKKTEEERNESNIMDLNLILNILADNSNNEN